MADKNKSTTAKKNQTVAGDKSAKQEVAGAPMLTSTFTSYDNMFAAVFGAKQAPKPLS